MTKLNGSSIEKTEINYKLLAEKAFFKRYVTDIYPSGVASYVSDTYDFWGVITEVAPWAKEYILNRKPNALGLAKVVFRPDSGDPVDILCGLNYLDLTSGDYCLRDAADMDINIVKTENGKYYEYEHEFFQDYGDLVYDCSRLIREVPEHEVKGAVECLWDIFGGTITSTGHKLLHERVGLIYGDSITLARANEILTKLEAKGFASGNVVFGIGSFTYQYMTRDTFGFAMKATYTEVDGVGYELYKEPKTGDGLKKSAKGLLCVLKDDIGYLLKDQVTPDQEQEGHLRTIFKDGVLTVDENLATIRARIEANLKELT